MALKGANNFRGGQTTRKRVNPALETATMEKIDGFEIGSGALVPIGGSTAVSTDTVKLRRQNQPVMLVSNARRKGIVTLSQNLFWKSNYDGNDTYTVNALCEYDGKLYAACDSGLILVYDGAAWSTSFSDATLPNVLCLYVFQGKLYAGTAADGRILVFDGEHWVILNNSGVLYDVHAFVSFTANGAESLYMARGSTEAGQARLERVNTTTGALTNVFSTQARQHILSLAVFNGELYCGYKGLTDEQVKLEKVAADESTTTLTITSGYDGYGVAALIAWNGKIYAGIGTDSGGSGILVSSDGVTWESETPSLFTEDTGNWQFVIWNDRLFAACTGAIGYKDPGTIRTQGWHTAQGSYVVISAISALGLYRDSVFMGLSGNATVLEYGGNAITGVEPAGAWRSTIEVDQFADTLSSPIKIGNQLVIPTKTGIRRIESQVVLSPAWVEPTRYSVGAVVNLAGRVFLCKVEHYANTFTNGPITGTNWTTYWTEIPAAPKLSIDPPSGIAPSLVVSSNIAVIVAPCNGDWDAVAKAAGVTTTLSTNWFIGGPLSLLVTLNSVTKSTRLCVGSVGADCSGKQWLTCSVNNTLPEAIASTSNPGTSGLRINLYSDALGTDLVGHAVIPVIKPGAQRIVAALVTEDGMSLTSVSSVALVTDSGWEHTGDVVTFYIDDIRAATTTELGGWDNLNGMIYPEIGQSYALARVQYYGCYAGPESRFLDNPRWVLSNPGDIATTALLVGPGDKVTCSFTPGTLTDYDVTHIAFYYMVIVDGAYLFRYAGMAALGVSLVHTGGTGAFDEALLLPEILEINHDPHPIAKHLLYADGCLYSACVDYVNGEWQHPLVVCRSTRNKPWYTPSVYSGSDPNEGGKYQLPAILGTEITALALWQTIKLVLLDSELFVMTGDTDSTTGFVYIASIRCASGRTATLGHDMAIWHGGDDFYQFAGDTPLPIGHNKVEARLVNLDRSHSAVYWRGLYILYCSYDDPADWSMDSAYLQGDQVEYVVQGVPHVFECSIANSAIEPNVTIGWESYWQDAGVARRTLLIYDTREQGWAIRSVPALVGIVQDRVADTIYAVNAGGWACELFSGTQELQTDGTYSDLSFDAWTAEWIIGVAGHDIRVHKLLIDAECSEDIILTCVIEHIGVDGNGQDDLFEIQMTPSQTQYSIELQSLGRAIKVKLNYTGQTPPTIYDIVLDTGDEKQRGGI
ncbi:MAG: hypothetical protein ABFD54_04515 [Armatimonadota bacterium]